MSKPSKMWQETLWILTKAVLKNIPGMNIPIEILQILEAIDAANQESEKNRLLKELENKLSSIEVTEIEFIQCADYKATLRYEPSKSDGILLLPIGGPPQKPEYDFSVHKKELRLNKGHESAFNSNERLIIIYSRLFQV